MGGGGRRDGAKMLLAAVSLGRVGSSASLARAQKLMSSALDTVSITWPWEIQEQLDVPLGDSGESPGQEGRVTESPALSQP